MQQVSIENLLDYIEADYQFIDIRDVTTWENGFIAGSIYLPYYADDALIPSLVKDPVHSIIICNKKEDIPSYLSTKCPFYITVDQDSNLPSSLPIDVIVFVEEDEFIMDIKHDKKAEIIDVRKQEAYDTFHIASSINIPLEKLDELSAEFTTSDKLYLVGDNGAFALCAATVLRNHGLINIRAVQTQPDRWENMGMPIQRKKTTSKKQKNS